MKKAIFAFILSLLLLVCAIAMPILFVLPFISEVGSAENQFTVPGSKEVTVAEDGRYYLWNNYQTIFEGKSFNSPEALPDGLSFRLISIADNLAYELVPDQSTTTSSAKSKKRSIGYYNLKKGKYRVTVTGEVTELRVFSFSKDMLGSVLMFIGSIFSTIVLAIISLVTCIVGIIFFLQHLANKKAEQGEVSSIE